MTEPATDASWPDELNPEQKTAVSHPDGPLLVVAGAGSGKTRTLAYRVAYLIAQGVSPERILLLTFTRRASEEMLKRASGIVAMTRARDFLYVTWPFRYYHRWSRFTDNHSYAQVCRFFTDEVCETLDRIDLRQEGEDDERVDIAPGAVRDISKTIREMWE